MFLTIISNVPVWVWPLLIGLLFLGLRATRERAVSKAVLLSMPLLALLSVPTLMHMEPTILVWTLYPLGYAIGTYIGYIKQARWLIADNGSRVTVSGEWLTLTSIMILFCANFVGGTISAMAPQIYTSLGFVAAYLAILATTSGLFAGRAIYIWRGRPTNAVEA